MVRFILIAVYAYIFILSVFFFVRFLVNKEFRYDTIVPGKAKCFDDEGITFVYVYNNDSYSVLYRYADVAFSSRIRQGSIRHLLINSKDPSDHYRYVLK